MSKQATHCRCLKCGSGFFTEIQTKKYCTEKCRKSAESARWRARLKEVAP